MSSHAELVDSPHAGLDEVPRSSWAWAAGLGAVLFVALVKVVVHVVTTVGLDYSYFVDELYFLAAAEHLDWGYVDLAPLMPALTALQVSLFGNGLLATRIFVVFTGGGLVLLAGLLARELGGGRHAQALAALAALTAPVYLAATSYNSMNGYEPLLWAAAAWTLARLANGGARGHWLLFGLLAGLALLTKHTGILFGLAALVGLALTPERRWFREPAFWAAGGIAALLFLPNLIWMAAHGFPHLEVLANIAENQRDVDLGALAFLAQQVAVVGPAGALISATGLVWLWARPGAVHFRFLAWSFLIAISLLILVDARIYYTNPVWTPLLAAGSVAIERRLRLGESRARSTAVLTFVAVTGAVLAPLAFPCLPPATHVRYSNALGISAPRLENVGLGALPHLHADRFGWRETAEAVAAVFESLTPQEQVVAAIFAGDYGRAGAIDRFGPELGLKKAISGHLAYFHWGPRGHTGEVVIVVGGQPEGLEAAYEEVALRGYVYHPWALPRSVVPIWLCRGLRGALDDLWPQVKEFS